MNDNLFHIAFYCATILVGLTAIIYTNLQKRTDRRQNRIFLFMNYVVLFNAITCLCSEFIELYRHFFLRGDGLIMLFQYVYFLVHTPIAAIFLYYVLTVTGSIRNKSVFSKILYLIPLCLTEFLVLTNPVTHFVYYYSEGMQFNRSWGEIIIYLVSIAYTVFAFICLMLSWNALTRRRRWAIVYFFILTIIGVVVQFLDISIKSELFAESIALIGLMLAVENEDDRLDAETDFYNRNALKMDVESLLTKKNVFYIVCVKITNIDSVRRITGLSNADEIVQEVAVFLKTLLPRYYIYHTDPNTMLLLVKEDDFINSELEALTIAEDIDCRFKSEWTVHGVQMKLSAVTIVASIPMHIHTLADLMYMIDTPVPKDIDRTILRNGDLKFLTRRAEVEAAITEGLKKGNFEVYYQPTYCSDGVTLHGAEALIRLHDPELGDLFPDEFIPIAEQTGYIDDIDDYVLNEVCAFLQSGEPTRLGMECINVNLSVVQCMQDKFVERIRGIVDSYGISKSLINFEITESVSASDYELLSKVITSLKENGFQFSMDDYGTGYSNMHSLFSLSFDIVKIDKSILWDAENSELGEIILESCIHMIKQMKRKILVEGVETKKHVEKLKKLGVDYYQGYFFSKPITKTELLSYCTSR